MEILFNSWNKHSQSHLLSPPFLKERGDIGSYETSAGGIRGTIYRAVIVIP
jgi:hypothetical protein